MLEMSRRLAILGAASPAVTFYHNVAAAHIDHWLDGYAHPFLDQRSDAAAAIVGHCRLLMELAPDSMPGHLAHHRETTLLTVLLHGIADMPDAVAFHRLSDAEISLLCATQADSYINHGTYKGVRSIFGVSYDFSVCQDPEYNRLAADMETLKAKMKEREKYLMGIPAEGIPMVDQETGDCYKIIRPLRRASLGYAVTFKK